MGIMTSIPKYPRTPYLPFSPSKAPDDRVIQDVSLFLDADLVITEKLDGGNTALHQGNVYARSTTAPSVAPWFGMTKKHHSWKLADSPAVLFGEDIYGLHSIEYDPVPEDKTFYAFALMDDIRYTRFASWKETVEFAERLEIPTVPVLYEGDFRTEADLYDFVMNAHSEPSVLGGEREGIVIRWAWGIDYSVYSRYVAKSVRPNHVQTDEHWTRNWKPCKIKRE